MAVEDAVEDIGSVNRTISGYRTEVTEPLGVQAMNCVLRLHHTVTSVVDAELKDGFGLKLVDYLSLRTLRDEAGATTLGHLAQLLGVHATTVTAAVDRLQQRHLVERQVHPYDRRVTLAGITDAGAEVVDAATRALSNVDFGMPGLTTDQRDSLATLCGQLPPRRGDR